VSLEAFDAQQVRGQSGTITAVVNALAKAGMELGENGSIFPATHLCGSCHLGMEEAMGRLVKLEKADYALHDATFICEAAMLDSLC
jgi:hypothetical protein